MYSLDKDLREDLLSKWRSRSYSLNELSKLTGGKVSRSKTPKDAVCWIATRLMEQVAAAR